MMRKTICLIAVLLSAVMLYAQKQAKALVEELNNPKSKKFSWFRIAATGVTRPKTLCRLSRTALP